MLRILHKWDSKNRPPKIKIIMKNRFFKIVPETFLGHLGGVGWSPACVKHVFFVLVTVHNYSVRGSVGDFPFGSFRSRVREGEIMGVSIALQVFRKSSGVGILSLRRYTERFCIGISSRVQHHNGTTCTLVFVFFL